MSTLAKMFEDAQISPVPDWFGEIEICHPVQGVPIEPRHHQITGLNLTFESELSRALLLDEQGTGKSLIACAYAAYHGAVGNRTLCLMPPVLAGQFQSAFLKGLKGIGKHLTCEIYRGKPKERQALLTAWQEFDPETNRAGWPSVVIMTYELFSKEWEVFAPRYMTLIADEARVLGNENNKLYSAIEMFMGPFGTKLAVAMNGTPASTDIRTLYGYINFCSPGKYYANRQEFDLLHVTYKKVEVQLKEGRTTWVPVVDQFKNQELLFANLYQTGRRVEKVDVLELPEKNIIEVSVDLDEAHDKMYKKFVDEKLIIFPDNTLIDGSTSAGLRTICMQAVVQTEMFRLTKRSAIFDYLQAIVDGLNLEKEKFFILCHHRKTVERVRDELMQYNLAVVYGGTKDKDAEVEKFNSDPSCKGLVANWVSGGVGLNLQENCSTVIVVEPTTVPGDFGQGTDRVHRSGQKHVVNVYLLIPKGTIYVKAVNTMTRREQEIREVISRDSLRAELLGQEEEPEDLAYKELATGW